MMNKKMIIITARHNATQELLEQCNKWLEAETGTLFLPLDTQVIFPTKDEIDGYIVSGNNLERIREVYAKRIRNSNTNI